MSDGNTTSAIDDKKTINEKGTTDPPPDWKNFSIEVVRSVVLTFIYYVVSGSIVLYLTKIAFANVLPTNPELYPFTNAKETVTDTSSQGSKPHSTITDINIVRGGKWYGLDTLLFNADNKTYSTKLEFNTATVDKEYSDRLIKYLRDSPSNPKKATIFGNFFSKVFFGTVGLNNNVITFIFSFLYSWFAESIIILIAPILLTSLFGISYFFNFFVFIYFYIVNIGLIFKDLVINGDNVEFKDLEFKDWTGFFWAALNFIIWMLFFWFGAFVYPLFIIVYILFKPLFLTGTNVTNKEDEKTMGFMSFFQNILLYKGPFFIFLMSLGMLGPAKTYLGSTGYYAAIVAVLVCIFFLHIYNAVINPAEDKNVSVINENTDTNTQENADTNTNTNTQESINNKQQSGGNKKRKTKKQKE